MSKKTKQILGSIFLLLLIGGTTWILIDSKTAPYQYAEGKIFGTYYHITYQTSNNLDQEIIGELNKVDASLSAFNDQSIVSQINRNEKVETNKMFEDVFDLSMQISDATNGAFDITVAPLVNLWGFGFKNSDNVTQGRIDSLMAFVGYKSISRQGHKIVKQHPETMLDFSAIAKGYGCDAVASLLESRGVSNYMIEIGGEIRAKGHNKEENNWNVGIVKPTDDSTQTNQQLQSILQMPEIAMATSGNYRNFYYKDGVKYAHTIDPSSGRPVQHSLLSATVIAPTCGTADAYATAFMVMGVEKATRLLEENTRIKAYLIYSDKNGELATWCSPSLQKYIENTTTTK